MRLLLAALEQNLSDIIEQILERSKDYTTPLKRFYRYIRDDTVKMFNILGRRGNTTPYRGVVWPWFADQYTRKTDGVVVPAHGGVDRVKGGHSYLNKAGKKYYKGAGKDLLSRKRVGEKSTTGPVRGRLKRSGGRIKDSDLVLVDRGNLRKAALDKFRVSPNRLVATTSLKHAKYQNKTRPFMFMNDNDLDVARDEIIDWLVIGENK